MMKVWSGICHICLLKFYTTKQIAKLIVRFVNLHFMSPGGEYKLENACMSQKLNVLILILGKIK